VHENFLNQKDKKGSQNSEEKEDAEMEKQEEMVQTHMNEIEQENK